MPLHLVPDAPKPAETEKDRIRKRIKALPKPKDMIQCHRCGAREVIETRIGVFGVWPLVVGRNEGTAVRAVFRAR